MTQVATLCSLLKQVLLYIIIALFIGIYAQIFFATLVLEAVYPWMYLLLSFITLWLCLYLLAIIEKAEFQAPFSHKKILLLTLGIHIIFICTALFVEIILWMAQSREKAIWPYLLS